MEARDRPVSPESSAWVMPSSSRRLATALTKATLIGFGWGTLPVCFKHMAMLTSRTLCECQSHSIVTIDLNCDCRHILDVPGVDSAEPLRRSRMSKRIHVVPHGD